MCMRFRAHSGITGTIRIQGIQDEVEPACDKFLETVEGDHS